MAQTSTVRLFLSPQPVLPTDPCISHRIEYSVHALHWALSNLLENNDEVVILRVIDPAEKTRPKGKEEARTEANEVLREVMQKNEDEERITSVIVEFAIGPIEETIHRFVRFPFLSETTDGDFPRGP